MSILFSPRRGGWHESILGTMCLGFNFFMNIHETFIPQPEGKGGSPGMSQVRVRDQLQQRRVIVAPASSAPLAGAGQDWLSQRIAEADPIQATSEAPRSSEAGLQLASPADGRRPICIETLDRPRTHQNIFQRISYSDKCHCHCTIYYVSYGVRYTVYLRTKHLTRLATIGTDAMTQHDNDLTQILIPNLALKFKRKFPDRDGPLDQDAVNFIADELASAGQNPTKELVRQVAGGGSTNSVHALLKGWWARFPSRYGLEKTPEQDIPDPLRAIWERMKRSCAEDAAQALQPERDQLAADRKHLDDEARNLAEAKAAIAAREVAIKETLQQFRHDLTAAQTRTEELQAALDAERANHAHTAAELASASAALTQAAKDNEQRLQAASVEAQQQADAASWREQMLASQTELQRALKSFMEAKPSTGAA